jgi:hypothetical protein
MNIKKTLVAVSSIAMALTAFTASAASFTLTPWTYDPDNTGGVVSNVQPDGSLHLEKNVPTATNAAAGAAINGVSGLSTTGMTLSYQVNGYCGAGAPRFNVYLSDGSTVFLGCVYGNDGSGNVSFTAGNTYGGVLFPTGQTVTGIDIVQDEQGQTTLSNIMVNGSLVTVTSQTLKDQCKNGGWVALGFKNQGQCVSSFASKNK